MVVGQFVIEQVGKEDKAATFPLPPREETIKIRLPKTAGDDPTQNIHTDALGMSAHDEEPIPSEPRGLNWEVGGSKKRAFQQPCM